MQKNELLKKYMLDSAWGSGVKFSVVTKPTASSSGTGNDPKLKKLDTEMEAAKKALNEAKSKISEILSPFGIRGGQNIVRNVNGLKGAIQSYEKNPGDSTFNNVARIAGMEVGGNRQAYIDKCKKLVSLAPTISGYLKKEKSALAIYNKAYDRWDSYRKYARK